MLPIWRQILVPLAIIHIKTNFDFAGWGAKLAKVGGACKEIIANGSMSDAGYDPLARVYALPVDGKVHVVNGRVTRMRGIGVGSKEDLISYGFSARTEPGASRFDCYRLRRVGSMHKHYDTQHNEDKYEQERT